MGVSTLLVKRFSHLTSRPPLLLRLWALASGAAANEARAWPLYESPARGRSPACMGVSTTREAVLRSSLWSAAGGGILGAGVSVVVNNALIEISLTPFFATVFGLVLLLLGALMLWRKLYEQHESNVARLLVMCFSILVLLSGLSCFLLEKDWFKLIPARAKVPMYMSLGISLSFAVSFSVVDLLNLYADRCGRMRFPLVSSAPQIFLVLTGAVAMGAIFGLIFGAMDVSTGPERCRTRQPHHQPLARSRGRAQPPPTASHHRVSRMTSACDRRETAV